MNKKKRLCTMHSAPDKLMGFAQTAGRIGNKKEGDMF
jgi:hypothetical protein